MQTDVNDLLRRVLEQGEWYKREWARNQQPQNDSSPHAAFKEAEAYLDSLEQGPAQSHEHGDMPCVHCRLDSLEAEVNTLKALGLRDITLINELQETVHKLLTGGYEHLSEARAALSTEEGTTTPSMNPVKEN